MDRLTATLREAFRSINRLPRLAIVGVLVVIVLAFLILAGLFVYLPYDLAMNGPKADAIQKDLENESKQIAPPTKFAIDFIWIDEQDPPGRCW